MEITFAIIAIMERKKRIIQNYFTRIARRYDITNDILSFGLHRYWKKRTVSFMPEGRRFMDLAGGTGDIAFLLKRRYPQSGVSLVDLNTEMLSVGSSRFPEESFLFIQADAEDLPFKARSFDGITLGFGLRNFQRRKKVVADVYRFLKPKGTFLCLEFGVPSSSFMRFFYRIFLFFLPFVSFLVSGEYAVYRYLSQSILSFPRRETVRRMMQNVGFSVTLKTFLFGVCTLYIAKK